MTKFLDDVELITAIVKVFDKDDRLLYEGGDASEWIIENPLEPDHVEVEGVGGTFSIDEYLREVDNQDEDYEGKESTLEEFGYYRSRTEK